MKKLITLSALFTFNVYASGILTPNAGAYIALATRWQHLIGDESGLEVCKVNQSNPLQVNTFKFSYPKYNEQTDSYEFIASWRSDYFGTPTEDPMPLQVKPGSNLAPGEAWLDLVLGEGLTDARHVIRPYPYGEGNGVSFQVESNRTLKFRTDGSDDGNDCSGWYGLSFYSNNVYVEKGRVQYETRGETYAFQVDQVEAKLKIREYFSQQGVTIPVDAEGELTLTPAQTEEFYQHNPDIICKDENAPVVYNENTCEDTRDRALRQSGQTASSSDR